MNERNPATGKRYASAEELTAAIRDYTAGEGHKTQVAPEGLAADQATKSDQGAQSDD
jgi:hypothetical protein